MTWLFRKAPPLVPTESIDLSKRAGETGQLIQDDEETVVSNMLWQVRESGAIGNVPKPEVVRFRDEVSLAAWGALNEKTKQELADIENRTRFQFERRRP